MQGKNDRLNVTAKQIQINEYEKETRYFAETNDGFDGTASGYGFKSLEKLHKAYWYFKNRDNINQRKNEAKKFLTENHDIKKIINQYFSVDNYIDALNDGDKLSFPDLIQRLESGDWTTNGHLISQKLIKVKYLWKFLLINI